jgi:hypothetical protein
VSTPFGCRQAHDEQLVGSEQWLGWLVQVQGGIASPGGTGSPITAVARYAGHLDLFTLGTDNRVYSSWWHEGQPWAAWFNVSAGSGVAGCQVAAISRIAEHLDLFTVGGDGIVYSTWGELAARPKLSLDDKTVNLI